MRTTVVSILLTFVAQTNAQAQSHTDEVMNRLGLGQGSTVGIKSTLSERIANKLLPSNFLKRGNMAPANVIEEKALAKNALRKEEEQAVVKAKVREQNSEKLLTKLKKGKFMSKEELAMKAKAQEKAFHEKLLASLIEEEKGLEAKVLAQKKKALEFAEVLMESKAKSKNPLSAAEKKEIEVQIEKNAQEYSHQIREELAEAIAMEKKTLGQPLSPAEFKIVEHLEVEAQKQLEASRVAMEEQIASQKKKALELVEILEENAAKSKHPLSAAEKKQVAEEIEKNSLQYAHDAAEELEATKALQKRAFGHPLSVVEEKQVEQFEAKISSNALSDLALLAGR